MTFNHTKHVELWNWLAENPGERVCNWPCWDKNKPMEDSPACEVARAIAESESVDSETTCQSRCPLKWNSYDNWCYSGGGEYKTWLLLTRQLNYGFIAKEDRAAHREKIRQAAIAVAEAPIRPIKGMEVI